MSIKDRSRKGLSKVLGHDDVFHKKESDVKPDDIKDFAKMIRARLCTAELYQQRICDYFETTGIKGANYMCKFRHGYYRQNGEARQVFVLCSRQGDK